MPQYRPYLRKPPYGYDYFFTQRYSPNPQNLWQGKHAIDISYGFKRPGDVLKLFPDVQKRTFIHVEDHQDLEGIRAEGVKYGLDPDCMRSAHGTSCLQYLKSLAESRVFFAPNSSRPLGGLANVDAAASGCILVGNRRDLWNPCLIRARSKYSYECVVALNQDSCPSYFSEQRERQESLLSRFLQYRVSMQLLSAIH